MHANQSPIPADHPRAKSLHFRETLVNGYKRGLVAAEGLIAHGRGEAYDYLLGEKTSRAAARAIHAACAMLLLSRHPVISVNGNTAVLCARTVVELAKITGAAIEVNLFYRSEEREQAIKEELELHGAKNILGIGARASAKIPELRSERRRVDPAGIFSADTVLVPLEDGDRTEALVKMGKTAISIDLNPLSRTALAAQITIVDNIVRAMPAMVKAAREIKGSKSLKKIVQSFNNKKNLRDSLEIIRNGI